MLEDILDYERNAFLWLNSCNSMFGDQFMWLFSSKIGWTPLAVMFIIILSYKNRERWKEILLIFVAIALVITLCDQFSSSFCKPFFARFRPTHHHEFMDSVNTVFDYRGGRYGFISSHASNAFGFATLTSLIFKMRFYSIMLIIWATVNSYSRIYLGVHFITDIIPGIISGILFGWIVYKIYTITNRYIIVGNTQNVAVGGINSAPQKGLNLIIYMLILTISVMAIISLLYTLNLTPAFTMK